MVTCFRQRAAQPVPVNRCQGKSVDRKSGLIFPSLGDDGVPYLLHVRDHARTHRPSRDRHNGCGLGGTAAAEVEAFSTLPTPT